MPKYLEKILHNVNQHRDDEKESMIEIQMKDSRLYVPQNFIILNENVARSCRYALVVECRNSEKYHVPHFVYFLPVRYKYDKTEILSLCSQKWIGFSVILQQQVTPIADPDQPGRYKNIDAVMASPEIGIFSIEATDDDLFSDDPPYGAMIIRNK